MLLCPSWDANRLLASQKIPRILWNPKVYYHIHKCLPPVPILSQLDPVHTPTSYFLKIHLNIILPSTPWSSKWSVSLRFSLQKPVYASSITHTFYMPRPSHLLLYYIILAPLSENTAKYLLIPLKIFRHNISLP